MKKVGLIVLVVVIVIGAAALYALRAITPRIIEVPELTGEVQGFTLTHEGRERTYQVYRPAGLSSPPAVLFVFHGSTSSGDAIREKSALQFDRLADEQGLLVVYPDGYENHWNDCRGRASYSANTLDIDDVGFIRQLVARFLAEYSADPGRVYATGLSNGGHMALRLALEAPDLIAGVAPAAANLPESDFVDCVPSGQPVDIAFIAGTNDPINHYEGGLVRIFGDESRGVVQSALATAQYFSALAGYGGEPQESRLPDSEREDDSWISVRQWQGREKRVALYTLVGGGHTFPSRNTRFGKLMGGDNRDVDTADLIWAFFTGSD